MFGTIWQCIWYNLLLHRHKNMNTSWQNTTLIVVIAVAWRGKLITSKSLWHQYIPLCDKFQMTKKSIIVITQNDDYLRVIILRIKEITFRLPLWLWYLWRKNDITSTDCSIRDCNVSTIGAHEHMNPPKKKTNK